MWHFVIINLKRFINVCVFTLVHCFYRHLVIARFKTLKDRDNGKYYLLTIYLLMYCLHIYLQYLRHTRRFSNTLFQRCFKSSQPDICPFYACNWWLPHFRGKWHIFPTKDAWRKSDNPYLVSYVSKSEHFWPKLFAYNEGSNIVENMFLSDVQVNIKIKGNCTCVVWLDRGMFNWCH